jgi:hypothetical protein
MPDHDTITDPAPNTVDGRPVVNDASRVDGGPDTSEPAGRGSAGEAMARTEDASDVDARPSATDQPVAVDPVAPRADPGEDSMNPHSLNPHGASGDRFDADTDRLGDRADGALDGRAEAPDGRAETLDGRAETVDGRAEALDGRADDRPVAEAPLTGSTMDTDDEASTVDGRDSLPATGDATPGAESDLAARSEQAAAEKADLVGVASDGDEPAGPIVSSTPDPAVARDDRQGDERPADGRLIDAPVADERATQERPVDGVAADERPVADRRDERPVDDRPVGDQMTDAQAGDQSAVDQAGAGSEPAALSPGDVEVRPLAALWPDDGVRTLRERWQDTQLTFVDNPRGAAAAADDLVGEAVDSLAAALTAQRSELGSWRTDGDNDTERLRVAMTRYREFLDHLLGV